MPKAYGYIAFIVLLAGNALQAQLPEFNMGDTTVTVCKGILLDSEAGPGGTIYGNNEDYSFTIDGGGPITLVFDPVFCTEANLDILTFHDGPNTGSPQIGPAYSGVVAPPPITSTGPFLTIHFVSDANVAYCGWEAQWTTDVPPPVPPNMSVPASPACNSTVVDLQFSGNVHCDSIYASAFTVSDQDPINVLSATALNCVGDSSTTAQLLVDTPFDSNCPFSVDFVLQMADRCDSIWTFTLGTTAQMSSCPIQAEVQANNDTICAGGCSELTAMVDGCLTYSYTWDQGLPAGPGPHLVCPTQNTTYTVNVVELGTGNTSVASFTIAVVAPQVPMADTVVCQSVAPFNIPGVPSGGYWTGPGMTDTLIGVFDPDTAGPGIHYVHYLLNGLCSDSVRIEVEEMDAGVDEAACPGSAPFMVSGFAPAGGTWSGPFISAGGVFDPSTPGSYVVTYSFGNCTDTKTINVEDLNGPTQTDTVCQSDWYFEIPATPYGGIWSGPGILDTLEGLFDPGEAGGGLHNLTYTLHGCDAQYQVYVHPIYAGSDQSSCPAQSPFLLPAATPGGGLWNGLGLVDANTGLYDPWQADNGNNENDTLTYALPNGCVDTMVMYVRWTNIGLDTLVFCESDDWIDLIWATTQRTPYGGTWTGPGILFNGGVDYDFDPTIAGVGTHTLHYFANDCQDSTTVIVYPDGLDVSDTAVCTSADPWVIAQLPQPAALIGPGVADPFAALFDPALAGPGSHTVYYWSPAWCIDSVEITVYPFEQAQISGPLTEYCSNDIDVEVELYPAGGTFSGLGDTLFNPATLTDGLYTLIYTVGNAECQTSDTLSFVVHPPLITQIDISEDSICGGGGTQIVVNTNGGPPNPPLTYQWSHGLFPVNTQSVAPEQTTAYTLITTDGCSDPVFDTIVIGVFDDFVPQFTTSAQQCYGETGFVEGSVIGNGNYLFNWNTSPPQTGDSIVAPAGESFTVNVVDQNSGCEYDTLVQVPAWPPVTALFSTNPNEDCIAFAQSDVTFIDLSNNAVGGSWVINGDTIPYVFGQNPSYDHAAAGQYDVELFVHNQGMCTDTFALEVCILSDTPVFIPDAFSPNGDGFNDVLYVRGPGIETMEFTVWDRWGSKVFGSSHPDFGWDGTARGERLPTGIYVYVLVARLNDGEKVEMTGDITLMR